jgi:hypothetical protein
MMKRILFFTAMVGSLAACSTQQQYADHSELRGEMNTWSVTTYQDDHVAAAVLSQHTLFPHHFKANSAELNGLGKRDLSILIDHYVENPGSLNIRNSDTPKALYDSRVAAVKEAMTNAGVNVAIGNDFAGGDGLTGDHVVTVLDAKEGLSAAPSVNGSDSDSGSGSGNSGGSK